MTFKERFGGNLPVNRNPSSSSSSSRYSSSSSRMMPDNSFAEQYQDRIFLRELEPGALSKKVIGLVIAKTEHRSFPDKKNPGQTRSTLTFTIRDTAEDFINVTCWGSDTFIYNLTQTFHTSDIVEIHNGFVQSKQNDEYEELYKPATPTALQLSVNETHSKVVPFTGSDFNEFSAIAYAPVKESNDYYTLGDIIANGNNLHGAHINILAALRDTGETKDITTKTGKQMKRRECKLFDDSCLSFPLLIWDGEVADQADSWSAKDTVLFLSDVKVTFDDFRRKMVATCAAKTIIITNPDIPEAHHLYSYAQSIDISDDGFASLQDHEIDLATIQDVYSLIQLEEKFDSFDDEQALPMPFSGILYACLSDLNLDIDEGGRCIVIRCVHCKRRVDRNTGVCMNSNCMSSDQFQDDPTTSTTRSLEIRVSLCDHTHGVDGFVMSRKVAEEFLKCDVDLFDSLDTKNLTDLKWKFLFERFKVYFKAVPPRHGQDKPYLSVLSIEEADFGEVIRCSA